MNLSLFDFLYWYKDFKSYLCLCLLYCSFISNFIHLDLVGATRIFFFFLISLSKHCWLNGYVLSHASGEGKPFIIISFLVSYLKFFVGRRTILIFEPMSTLDTCRKRVQKFKDSCVVWCILSTTFKPREVQRLQSIWKIHVLQCVMSNISLTMIKYSCREGRRGESLKGKPVREPLILLYFFGWFVSTLPLELNLISLALESIIKPLKLCSMLFLLTPTFSFSCKKQD